MSDHAITPAKGWEQPPEPKATAADHIGEMDEFWLRIDELVSDHFTQKQAETAYMVIYNALQAKAADILEPDDAE